MIDLTIAIPVYNSALYLENCLESIHFSDKLKIEIIIVDDRSTDQSIEIIEAYQKRDSRISLYKLNENQGLIKARKFLLEKASGRYIYFADSDDEIIFDNLIIAYELAAKHDLDVFIGEALKMGSPNQLVKNTQLADRIITGKTFYVFSSKGKFKGIGIWRNIYNREFLNNHFHYEKEDIFYEDNYIFPDIHMAANRVMYRDLKIYKHFIRSNSIISSNENYYQKIYSRQIIIKHYLAVYDEAGNDEAFRKATYNFISYSLLEMFRIDIESLDKVKVKACYKEIPVKAYFIAMKSDSKMAKLICPILLMNKYLGRKLLSMIERS